MAFKMKMEDAPPRKTEAFPEHDFRHRYFLVDDADNPVANKSWLSGEPFDWKTQLVPADPGTDWWAFVKDINQLIEDAMNFREKEIPRLQKKEESLAKIIDDLSFHMEAQKKDLAKAVNRNVRNSGAYYTLKDYEARFNLLHGLAQLAQVQSQVIDLITACIIRRIQARMKWLLPLFCKIGMRKPNGPVEKLNEMVDEEPFFELYVWHPYTDDDGNILEEYLEPDSMRDFPMILQQLMDPAKYREELIRHQEKAKRAKQGKVLIANESDMKSMTDFQKKFGEQLGKMGKK